ncbi:winged helix-turn-helix domain-containing protein [Methanonatronarchaeum sp. AMET-Sl]|uniref:winged helix-turn-helix domain-containing protein n=1 Tax=Methanonatronarchaeum sp. AMET-Sl TaxID=3037654 RepID=UPI00244E32C7|nr:winged helix-turn-helix domain-containing protein [Methanonatronarchaeum sp. AMET-Sl]WGI16807.1 winged helix-turn-helix domain-containing protein [Methanonatronarchaeum sp. AMET-Sl]
MSVDEAKGYVIGNANARQIISVLKKNGASEPEFIIKKRRLIETAALQALDELKEKGLVEKTKNEYSLTDLGKKVAEEVHELERD